MNPTFSELFTPLHHLFTIFSFCENGVKQLKEKHLRRHLFRIEGAELYEKK